MILFLVGYAGSGKSSLAKRLSRRLGVKFLDTDKLVEEREGASIADIFFYQGEEYFRRIEREVIEEFATELSLDIHVAPTIIAGFQTCAKIPVAFVSYCIGDKLVDLL